MVNCILTLIDCFYYKRWHDRCDECCVFAYFTQLSDLPKADAVSECSIRNVFASFVRDEYRRDSVWPISYTHDVSSIDDRSLLRLTDVSAPSYVPRTRCANLSSSNHHNYGYPYRFLFSFTEITLNRSGSGNWEWFFMRNYLPVNQIWCRQTKFTLSRSTTTRSREATTIRNVCLCNHLHHRVFRYRSLFNKKIPAQFYKILEHSCYYH